MAGPGPTCSWEQRYSIQDGTSCLAESRLPGTLQKRDPWVWERGQALYEAFERALKLAPGAIYEQTGYALGEVLKALLPGLVEMLVVLAATTAIGAAAGAVVGFFFGGAGAAPGAVIGADLGFDVGLAALTWLGVAFLAQAMIAGFGRLWNQLSLGVKHAWEAPEFPEREYARQVEQAGHELAAAAGILMLLVLQAAVAWVLKRAAAGATQSAARTLGAARTAGSEAAADAAVGELVAKLSRSKLGGEFAKWFEENWPKLKKDPRLRLRPTESGAIAKPEAGTSAPKNKAVPESRQLAPYYPPNRGFLNEPVKQVLQPGTIVDRYGGPGGSFVSPQGVPAWERSLPPGAEARPLKAYEVMKPLEVEGGPTAPWFNQPGGGIQYDLGSKTVQNLIDGGYLRPIK